VVGSAFCIPSSQQQFKHQSIRAINPQKLPSNQTFNLRYLNINITSSPKQLDINNKTTMSSTMYTESPRQNSILSTRSMKNGLKTIAQKYKEHDRQVNAAWQAYYGVGYPTQSAMAARPSQSRNSSSASEESVRAESSPSTFSKAVKAVKQRAKEHHDSVGSAYTALHGDLRVRQ
jgi:hypothetical protein